MHAQNSERTPPEKGARWMYGSSALACVLFGTRAFLVLYLSSSHTLMSGGPVSRPDYYLTCNGSTGGVSDTDRLFSGRLLTRNAWKLMNKGRSTQKAGVERRAAYSRQSKRNIYACTFFLIIKLTANGKGSVRVASIKSLMNKTMLFKFYKTFFRIYRLKQTIHY